MLAWRQGRDAEDNPDPRTPLLQWRGKPPETDTEYTSSSESDDEDEKLEKNTAKIILASNENGLKKHNMIEQRFAYVFDHLDPYFRNIIYWTMFVQDLIDYNKMMQTDFFDDHRIFFEKSL